MSLMSWYFPFLMCLWWDNWQQLLKRERICFPQSSWVSSAAWDLGGGPVALGIQSGLAAGRVRNPASERRWCSLGLFSWVMLLGSYSFFPPWWLPLQRCTCILLLWFSKRFMNTLPMERESFFLELFMSVIFVGFFCLVLVVWFWGFFFFFTVRVTYLLSYLLLDFRFDKLLNLYPHTDSLFFCILMPYGVWGFGVRGRRRKRWEITFTMEIP